MSGGLIGDELLGQSTFEPDDTGGSLSANIAGSSTVTIAMSGAKLMSATMNGHATVTADVRRFIPALVPQTIVGTSTVTASMRLSRRLSATIAGSSSLTANLTHGIRFNAVLAGRATETATISRLIPIAATIHGIGHMTANAIRVHQLTATAHGIAHMTAGIKKSVGLTLTVNGIGHMSAAMFAPAPLTAEIDGTGTMTINPFTIFEYLTAQPVNGQATGIFDMTITRHRTLSFFVNSAASADKTYSIPGQVSSGTGAIIKGELPNPVERPTTFYV